MPELRESLASFNMVQMGLEYYSNCPRNVLGLWTDPTTKEQATYKAKNGRPVRLTCDCKMKRGTKGVQTYLLAEELRRPPQKRGKKNTNPIPEPLKPPEPVIAITDLCLKDVHFGPRELILDLGPLWLKVHFHVLFLNSAL